MQFREKRTLLQSGLASILAIRPHFLCTLLVYSFAPRPNYTLTADSAIEPAVVTLYIV